jgi:hypothetical protein
VKGPPITRTWPNPNTDSSVINLKRLLTLAARPSSFAVGPAPSPSAPDVAWWIIFNLGYEISTQQTDNKGMGKTFEIYCQQAGETDVLYATTDNDQRAQCIIEAMNAWQDQYNFYWKEYGK